MMEASQPLNVPQNSGPALYNLGVGAMEQGDLDGAMTHFGQAIQSAPELHLARLNKGVIHFQLGQYRQAIECFQQTLALCPGCVDAYVNLAKVLGVLEMPEEATQILDQALRIAPDYYDIWYAYGETLLSARRPEEALQKLETATTLAPDDWQGHFLLANALSMLGDKDKAIDRLAHARTLAPDNMAVLNNLALLLFETGRREEALECLRHAVRVAPADSAILHNLGKLLLDCGANDEAIAVCRRAADLAPGEAAILTTLGVAHERQGQFDEAIACFEQILKAGPETHELLYNLAWLNHLDSAISYYQRALDLIPDDERTIFHLAVAFKDKEDANDKAISCYRRLLEINPDHVQGHNDLGLCLQRIGKPEEAWEHYHKTIEFDPSFASGYLNLGTVCIEAYQDYERAEEYLQKARQLAPEMPLVWYNLGLNRGEQNRYEEAVTCYRRAIELNPELVEAHWNLSIALLLLGQYEEGFREYTWRWQRKAAIHIPRFKPEWQPEQCPPDARVLLITEQGMGDSLQFIRYAPMVRERAGKVLVVCEEALVDLFSRLDGIDEVIDKREINHHLDAFDYQVPLLDLPRIFGTDADSIPCSRHAYITAPAELEALGREVVATAAQGAMKIGLVWRGNPVHKNDHNRSSSLAAFGRLLEIKNCAFFSLQKNNDEALPKELIDLAPHLKNFSHTAAIIEHLDLVITVDTAVAHLAGAMGKEVWALIPYLPDWRWLAEGETSPWYPTMRLFRQGDDRSWPPVLKKIAAELESTIAQR